MVDILAYFCLLIVVLCGANEGDVKLVEQLVEPLQNLPDRISCGTNWQGEYANVHKNALLKPRRVVAIPNLSGFADRIVGLVTVCVLGIVTNRAFQVGRRPELPNFEKVFTGPFINWTRAEDPEWLIEPLKYKASVRNYNQTVLDSKQYFGVNTIDDIKLQDKLLRQDINLILGGADVVDSMVAINRGKTIRIFENSHHKDQLLGYGLTANNAFGCVFDFIFKPKPEIFVPIIPQLQRFQSKNTLRIGIQIRAGDWYLFTNGQHTVALTQFNGYFSCAEQIEKFARTSPDQEVIWYLMTDSVSLRQSAVDKYGTKVVTSLSGKIEHSSKEASVCKTDCTVSDDGFFTAAAEWWLFGACDYHVISKHSGYGRSAGMRARRLNSIYTINNARAPVTCDASSFTDLENIYYDWSGI